MEKKKLKFIFDDDAEMLNLIDSEDTSNSLERIVDKIMTPEEILIDGSEFKGEQGEKGDTGDKGDKGEKGDKGNDGKDGKNGKNGSDGLNGVDGKDGVDGSIDDALTIVEKLNTLENVLDVSVIKDAIDKKYVDAGMKKIDGRIKLIDQRWHGGGLSKVTTDSTLTGTGTPASPLHAVGGSPLTTKGDIYGHNATVDARIPVGANNTVLTADSTQALGVKWVTPSTTSPGGSTNNIQYNNGAGGFGGTNNATVDSSGNAAFGGTLTSQFNTLDNGSGDMQVGSTITASSNISSSFGSGYFNTGLSTNLNVLDNGSGNLSTYNPGGSNIIVHRGVGDGYTYVAEQFTDGSNNIWEFDYNAPNNGDQTMAFHYAAGGSFFSTPVWIIFPPTGGGNNGSMGVNISSTSVIGLDVLGAIHSFGANYGDFFLSDPVAGQGYLGDITGGYGNHTYLQVDDSASIISIHAGAISLNGSGGISGASPLFTDGSNNMTSSGVVPIANGGTGQTSLVAAGIPKITSGRFTAQTAAKANIVPFTVGGADSSFLVWSNILVTASTLNSFTTTVTYTDESNTSRTLTLNFSQLTGAFITTITNATGAAPYEGVPVSIRCKASTAITISTTGTFTTVTYNVESFIQQIK